jgi:hypothetical protein
MMDVSEIGVSSTRSTPNSSGSPLNCPKTPPWSAISSPIANTIGSRRISSCIAAMVTPVKVISVIGGPRPVCMAEIAGVYVGDQYHGFLAPSVQARDPEQDVGRPLAGTRGEHHA